MSGEQRGLAGIAASLVDGDAIDWQEAEASVDPAERRLIRHLRLVASISHVHRTVGADAAEDVAAPIEDLDGRKWGRLVLHERIGQGTSCEVYRAWDTELHRDVALKLLRGTAGDSSSAHSRVLAEARRLARVNHENVVRVYGAEQHDGRVGLWMELVAGESLDETVRTRGRFSAAEAALIGQHLCAAVAAVHSAGLLHRDVKAQNVMRDATGRMVLMDFGTGEPVLENQGTNRLIGTPLYLAPEIFAGRAASVQSDLYSLGVTLFHLVTGKFPCAAVSMEGLADAHARGEVRRLRDLRPDLPAAFVAAVERALERDPARRYRTAGEMEAALRQSLDIRTPIAGTARGGIRRARWAFGGVAAVLLLTVSALIVWTRGGPAVVGADARGIRTIAILPLIDHSPAVSPPYLAEAITDRITATLGHVANLQITSASSSKRFRDTALTLPEIARALEVDGLLQGGITVLPAGSGQMYRVQVNADLIAASTGAPIWSRTFVGTIGEMSRLQREIVRELAAAIGADVTPEENAVLTNARQTSPKAEEAYLAGRYHLGQYGLDSTKVAIEALERAIALDSDHAAARADLAHGYMLLGTGGAMPAAKARQLAMSEVNRALAIDADLAEAHAVRADLVFYYDWNWVEAEREYRRAIDLQPSGADPRGQYARFLAAARRLPEAVLEAATARRLDPASAGAAQTHGLVLFYAGRYAEAEAALKHAAALDPESVAALVVLGRVYEAQGRYEDALELTERAIQISTGVRPPLRIQAIRLQALAGRSAAAREAFRALTHESRTRALRIAPEHLAYLHLAFGDRSRALDHLETAVEEREAGLLWLAVDPRVEPLRNDERFAQIVRTLGIP